MVKHVSIMRITFLYDIKLTKCRKRNKYYSYVLFSEMVGISKAFDCLDHVFILSKTEENRFLAGLISWNWDHQQNRSAQVNLGYKFKDLRFGLEFHETLFSYHRYHGTENLLKIKLYQRWIRRWHEHRGEAEKQKPWTHQTDDWGKDCNAKLWCRQDGFVINAKKRSV